jgi:hypothetical protein
MGHLLTIMAVAALGLGGRHYYSYLKNKKKRGLAQKKLEVWEGEGGAVPVAPDRTAAQVAPREPHRASPGADS